MTKRLVSFDNEKPDLGLPDAVQERMDARYSGIEMTPHVGPNGNWWVGETDTGTPAQGDQGPKGDQGIQGPAGADGVDGEQGPQGDKGDKGEDGRSVTITGTVATVDDLPQEGSISEGYLTESDGHLHIWDGSGWTDVGEIRGPQGIQGPQGDPGERGPKGEQGPAGITPGILTGATTTGAPGTSAFVVRTPSGNDHIFTFTIPRGDKGDTGDKGDKGEKGEKGDTGPAGTTSFLELNDVPPTFPPESHTHSQYATTAQVEARNPEIRVVSSPEQATSPGVLYVVTED